MWMVRASHFNNPTLSTIVFAKSNPISLAVIKLTLELNPVIEYFYLEDDISYLVFNGLLLKSNFVVFPHYIVS